MDSALCSLARRFVITLRTPPTKGQHDIHIAIAIAYQPDSTERSPITEGTEGSRGGTEEGEVE